jgi:hypothetical protein
MGRGGARPGAGRKKSDETMTIRFNLRVPADLYADIVAKAEAEDMKPGELARDKLLEAQRRGEFKVANDQI